MKLIFLDTVGLIALWDESDQWHKAASAAMALLNASRIRLITTPQILLECGNAAARKPYRPDVCLLRDRLAKHGDLIVPSDTEFEQAWAAYRRGPAGSPGVVDHISFVVMRRVGITDAFTNDRHFKTAGFNALF